MANLGRPDTPAARLTRAARYLVAAEAVLIACVALCVQLIPPVGAVQTDGLSVYGTRARTLAPYGLGMLAISAACLAAGRLAERAGLTPGPPLALRTMSGLVVGLLVTPYSSGPVLNWTHMLFGGALFFSQLALAMWLALRVQRPLLWLLFAAQLSGDLIAFASLPEFVDALLFGELLSQLAFMPLLALALRSMAHYHSVEHAPSPTRAQIVQWGASR